MRSSTTDLQDFRLNYSKASFFLRGDVLSLSLAVSHANFETSFEIAVFIDLLSIIRGPYFDTKLFNIQVKSIKCFLKTSGRIVSKHKLNCGLHSTLD